MQCIPQYDLSLRNTFRMRVRCALYVDVTSEEDLLQMDWSALPQPVFVMGGGSNLLFTGDFPGTVLHVGISFRSVERKDGGEVLVTCGAGVVFDDFCAWAAAEGLWGPENLSLIPGECGASAVQNIGAYGVEAKDILCGIRAYDRQEGRLVEIDPAACAYGYRSSLFKSAWKGRYVITSVSYRLQTHPRPQLDYGGVRKALEGRYPDCPEAALTPRQIRDTVVAIREQKLPDPAVTGSAGSFFCNPVIPREHFARIVDIARAQHGPEYNVPHYEVGGQVKVPAAWMIDQCGFKGRRRGGAQVCPTQPLVLINASGEASPQDVIGLEEEIISAVAQTYGITLHPEVEHI